MSSQWDDGYGAVQKLISEFESQNGVNVNVIEDGGELKIGNPANGNKTEIEHDRIEDCAPGHPSTPTVLDWVRDRLNTLL